MQVGLIGAGHIGGLLADAILATDHSLVVHDVEESQVTPLVDRGASSAPGPAAVGEHCDAVLLALPGAPEVTAVALESGLLDALDPGDSLIDTSTTGPDAAERVAEAAADRDVTFVSAPVTRGGPGPDDGLHAMVGGTEAAHAAVTDLLDVVTLDHAHVGDAGTAQRFKLLLQLRYAGQAAVDAEVVAAGRDLDVPVELLADFLDLDVSERLLDGDFSPAIPGMGGFAIWQKDLGYLLDVTTETGTATPLASEIHAAYTHADRVKTEDERHAAAIRYHWRRLNGA
ncbi:MAG: NAD(P)-dependent oxidoreductase [Halobacteriaceae archaeon]